MPIGCYLIPFFNLRILLNDLFIQELFHKIVLTQNLHVL